MKRQEPMIGRLQTTAPAGLVRSKSLENLRRQQPMIRSLEVTTMGGTILYDNRNVTFNQYRNIRIRDDLLFFPKIPLIRTTNGAHHMDYKPYLILNHLTEINSTNMKSEFAQMINKDIILSVNISEYHYKFNGRVIDVNNNRSNIVINEITNYDDNTVRNLYRAIELQVHTPNFIIYVKHPNNNRIVIPRTHRDHKDIFPIPLNYYPITVVLQ